MKWGEITEWHPGRFVLVKAIKTSSNHRLRHLENMAIIVRQRLLKLKYSDSNQVHRRQYHKNSTSQGPLQSAVFLHHTNVPLAYPLIDPIIVPFSK